MGTIILIGGGEIKDRQTENIDRTFLEKAGGKHARLLFFPTAANDSPGYSDLFEAYYRSLGCQNIKIARLSSSPPGIVKGMIEQSTGIYLGGGSTAELIRVFRSTGADEWLAEAVGRGKILAGMSAGAMCLGDWAILSENDESLRTGPGFGIIGKIIPVAHFLPEQSGIYKPLKDKIPDARILGIPEGSAALLSDGKIEPLGVLFES